MKKTILDLGKCLSKAEQRTINGGGSCSGYNGPIIVTCAQYEELPTQYKGCVLVHSDCFPQ